MNKHLRSAIAMILLFASVAFSLPVAAEGREACVAPYRQLGYVETVAHGDPIPECSPAGDVDSDDRELCVRQGPPAIRIGLSTSTGFFAATCPSPYELMSLPTDLDTETTPEIIDCNTIVSTALARHC